MLPFVISRVEWHPVRISTEYVKCCILDVVQREPLEEGFKELDRRFAVFESIDPQAWAIFHQGP